MRESVSASIQPGLPRAFASMHRPLMRAEHLTAVDVVVVARIGFGRRVVHLQTPARQPDREFHALDLVRLEQGFCDALPHKGGGEP